MIHVRVFPSGQSLTVTTSVALSPVTTPLTPSEILIGASGTGTPYKLADLSANTTNEAQVTLQNKAAFSVFWGYGTPGTPNLTTGNGIELLAGAYLILDNIGGAVIWGSSGTPQTAGSGTRVTGVSRP